MKDPIEVKKHNENLSAAITLALNLDNLFKLYSYRCIEPEIFIESVQTELEKARTISYGTPSKIGS